MVSAKGRLALPSGDLPHLAPLICHPSARRWGRRPVHPGVAGPRQHRDDRAIHARDPAGVGADQESVGQHAVVEDGGGLPPVNTTRNLRVTRPKGVLSRQFCVVERAFADILFFAAAIHPVEPSRLKIWFGIEGGYEHGKSRDFAKANRST
jgi:hypothetical protein